MREGLRTLVSQGRLVQATIRFCDNADRRDDPTLTFGFTEIVPERMRHDVIRLRCYKAVHPAMGK